MEKKVIIYIGGFQLPDKNAAAHRVLNNARALKKLGYEVVFLDVDDGRAGSIENSKSDCFGFTKYSMVHSFSRFTSIWDFIYVYHQYNTNVCAVIAYNYPSIALAKLRKFCRKKDVRLFADCTEWFGFEGSNPLMKCIRGMDSYLRMSVIQPRLDGVIAISKYLEDYYKEKTRTICVPPLTDLSEEKWKCVENVEHTGIQIVYAGSPGKHKDKINRMIEALFQENNLALKLIIIGITKEQFLAYYPEEESLIHRLQQKVVFLGRIPHREALKYIQQADFSMFYREITRVTMAGFPTKFAESISCGTPVITNATSDLKNYLIEGTNGIWINHVDDFSNSQLFMQDEKQLKAIKAKVDRNLFDYNNYIEEFKKMF